MKWTKTPPKVEGWYWEWQKDRRIPVYIVYIDAAIERSRVGKPTAPTMWQGPLPPPEPPKE
jgi:hypothetical protein